MVNQSKSSRKSPQAAVKKTVVAANAGELKTEHQEVAELFATFEFAGTDDIVHARGKQAGRGDA